MKVPKAVFADGGKRFDSLINQERLPYTWGEVKNGKLGLDSQRLEETFNQGKDNKSRLDSTNQKKNTKVKQPEAIPFFEEKRAGTEKDLADNKQADVITKCKNMYNQDNEVEERAPDGSAIGNRPQG